MTDCLMRQVLTELAMLMHGKTQSWNSTGGKDVDRDPRPNGDSYPIAEAYAHRYALARNEVSRRIILSEAREELRQWRGHGTKRHDGESRVQEEARMVREGKGWTVEAVAQAFNCTPTRVRRACLEHGVLIDYLGILGERVDEDATARAERAARMNADGIKQEEIALQLGVSQATVSRLIRNAPSRREQAAA